MRSYRQYCGLAKALDVIGDRWTLLIVREMLIRRSCRYTDLSNGLPGIPSNLLAKRLRELEQAGIVSRMNAPPPIATTLFQLTPRGLELEASVLALGAWGSPLLMERSNDAFCTHWLALPLKIFLADHAPERPPVSIEIRTGDEPMTLETVNGAVRARPGASPQPDAVLTGIPHVVLGLLSGRLDLAEARAAGLRYGGDIAALRRVLPRAPRATSSRTHRSSDLSG
jgi:DNA-binding HxlR family transcriptional regulator